MKRNPYHHTGFLRETVVFLAILAAFVYGVASKVLS